MRIEDTKTGWKEITTKEINITLFGKEVFSTAGQWVEFTKKQPGLNKKGRNHCEHCQIKWENCDPNLNTYLIFTDKGNKILCEPCYVFLKSLKLNLIT